MEDSAPRGPEPEPLDVVDAGGAIAAAGLSPAAAAVMAAQASAGNHAVANALARQEMPGLPSGAGVQGAVQDAAALAQPVLDFCAENPVLVVRTPLEALRLLPGLGAIPGFASDIIEAGSDLMSIPTSDAFPAVVMGGGIVLRSGLNILANGVAQVEYLNQTVELIMMSGTVTTALSGAGIPVATIAGAIASFQAGVSGFVGMAGAEITGALGVLDGLITLGAGFAAVAAAEDNEAWANLAAGYLANTIADAVGVLFELAGAASLGVFPSGALNTLMRTLKNLAKIFLFALGGIVNFVNGVWKLVGGGVVSGMPSLLPEEDEGLTPTAPSLEGTLPRAIDRSLARQADASSDAALHGAASDLDLIRNCIDVGGGTLSNMVATVGEFTGEAKDRISEAVNAEGGFDQIKGALQDALTELRTRADSVSGIQEMSAEARAQLGSLDENLSSARGLLDEIAVPEFDVSAEVELGDNVVADTIEGGFESGAEVVQSVIDAARAELQEVVDEAKETALEGLESVTGELGEVVPTLELVEELAGQQLATLNEVILGLEEAVAGAETGPELVDAILGELYEAVGIDEGVELEDILGRWQHLGTEVDRAAEAVQARLSGEPPDEG